MELNEDGSPRKVDEISMIWGILLEVSLSNGFFIVE